MTKRELSAREKLLQRAMDEFERSGEPVRVRRKNHAIRVGEWGIQFFFKERIITRYNKGSNTINDGNALQEYLTNGNVNIPMNIFKNVSALHQHFPTAKMEIQNPSKSVFEGHVKSRRHHDGKKLYALAIPRQIAEEQLKLEGDEILQVTVSRTERDVDQWLIDGGHVD